MMEGQRIKSDQLAVCSFAKDVKALKLGPPIPGGNYIEVRDESRSEDVWVVGLDKWFAGSKYGETSLGYPAQQFYTLTNTRTSEIITGVVFDAESQNNKFRLSRWTVVA